jgi:hypothetical protein
MGNARLRFAYRMLQFALVVACLALAARWYDHHQNAQHIDPNLSKKKQMLASTEQLLTEVRQQRDIAKAQLEKAQSRLAAAETRQSAAKEHP